MQIQLGGASLSVGGSTLTPLADLEVQEAAAKASRSLQDMQRTRPIIYDDALVPAYPFFAPLRSSLLSLLLLPLPFLNFFRI